VRASSRTHVLDGPYNPNLQAPKHLHSLTGIEVGDQLWGDDNERAGAFEFPDQDLLHRAGSWGQINDEILEVWPGDPVDELLRYEPCGHRINPERLVLAKDKSGGHDREILTEHRFEAPHRRSRKGPVRGPFLVLDSDHGGDVGTIKVEIKHSHGAVRAQSSSEIQRYGRLAYAALSRANRDNAGIHPKESVTGLVRPRSGKHLNRANADRQIVWGNDVQLERATSVHRSALPDNPPETRSGESRIDYVRKKLNIDKEKAQRNIEDAKARVGRGGKRVDIKDNGDTIDPHTKQVLGNLDD